MNVPQPGSRTIRQFGTPCGVCGYPMAALWLVDGRRPVPLHATDDGLAPCGENTRPVVIVTTSLPYEW